MHQHETAGAVGVLDHPGPVAELAEQRRLLVAGDAGDRHPRGQKAGRGMAVDLAGIDDLGQD